MKEESNIYGLRSGDKIFCHTDGFMSESYKEGESINGPKFCSKGKLYKIIAASSESFLIIDERKLKHSFQLKELGISSKWFKIKERRLLLETTIKPQDIWKFK